MRSWVRNYFITQYYSDSFCGILQNFRKPPYFTHGQVSIGSKIRAATVRLHECIYFMAMVICEYS